MVRRRLPVARAHQHRASTPPGAPTVVLLHGLGVSSRYFAPAIEALAGHARVLAPELPGTGRSDKPDEPLDVAELADALASWCDGALDAPAVVVANSMGCQVVVDMAVRHPGRASALVLIGPTMDASARTARAQIFRWLRDGRHESVRQFPLLVLDYLEARPRRMLKTFRAGLRNRIEDALPLVDLPTVVVRGEHDPIAPQAWVDAMVRLLPAGRLAVLGGAAHAAHFTHPHDLAPIVLALR